MAVTPFIISRMMNAKSSEKVYVFNLLKIIVICLESTFLRCFFSVYWSNEKIHLIILNDTTVRAHREPQSCNSSKQYAKYGGTKRGRIMLSRGKSFCREKREMEKTLFEKIIPFWASRGIDQEYGGYLLNFDENGKPDGGQDK